MIVTVFIPDRNIWSALIAGIDSGIHYWCKSVEGADVLRKMAVRMAGSRVGVLFSEWCAWGSLTFEEREASRSLHDGVWHLRSRKLPQACAALAINAPHQFGRLLVDGGDADTGDALIQCALFGEIVYG